MNRYWGADADPTAQGRIKGARPVAVLDIGSNSVRLVVYERHARSLTPLYNEKASCALGRGVAASGRLADENTERALTAIQRFALVTKLMRVAMLMPTLLIVALCFRQPAEQGVRGAPLLPWFAVAFALLVVLNSVLTLPEGVRSAASMASQAFLVVAIAAVGLKTSLREVAEVGWRPAAIVVGSTVWLAALAALYLHFVH